MEVGIAALPQTTCRSRGSTCRCYHISHANSGMLWQWFSVFLLNHVGCNDVGCLRWFQRGQVIDLIVKCENLTQLLNIFCLDDEAIPRVEIFPNCFRDIAYNHQF